MKVLALALAFSMVSVFADVLPPMVPATDEVPRTDIRRRKEVKPVASGELRVEPLFTTASVVYGADRKSNLAFQFRKVGADGWEIGELPPYYSPEFVNWRVMLSKLAEDTEYELRVVERRNCSLTEAQSRRGDEVLAKASFRTWSSWLNVAKVITIDPKMVKLPLVISDRGAPDAWIRYTMEPGTRLVNTNSMEGLIVLDGAKYVSVDRLNVVGGPVRRVIDVIGCENVRVRNCEISGWGVENAVACPDGVRFWYKSAKMVDGRRVPNGDVWSAAIHARNSKGTVIERCYIHDPNLTSVAWRYYHPYGPNPIVLGKGMVSTVVRYNDLVGDDAHRWDDAITSNGNFHDSGGPGRSVEIYGNFCLHPNDDCIELDGAQQNVACWGNRFEGGLVGISLQGNMVSPSYVYDNLISGRGDYFGESGQAIKTSGFDWVRSYPYSLVMRNVVWDDAGTGLFIAMSRPANSKGAEVFSKDYLRIDAVDNVFCGRQGINVSPGQTNAVLRGNRIGVRPTYDLLDPAKPVRPLGFTLDTARIDFNLARDERKVMVKNGSGERFRVLKTAACDWFAVEPTSGEIRPGTEFSIRLDERRLVGAPAFRGAFIVRTDDGLSRPVTIYANAPYAQPMRCEKPGDVALYTFPKDSAIDSNGFITCSFEVPKKGRYFVMSFAQAERRPIVSMAFDDEEVGRTVAQTCPDYPVWGILSNHHNPKPENRIWGGRVRWYDLEPGVHRLRLRYDKSKVRVDALVLTDNPLAFEPKTARVGDN